MGSFSNIKNAVNELIRIYLLSTQSQPVLAAESVVSISGSTVTAVTPTGSVIGNATTVIQAAIDNTAGGMIHIKPGTYTLTAALTIQNAGTIIEGEGSTTILQWDGSAVTGGFIKMADTTVRGHIQIRDLQLASTVANNGLAINADYFTLAIIQNVVLDSINQGIDISNGNAFYNKIINPRIICGGASGFGIRLAKNDNLVIGSRISANDSNNVTGIIVNAHGCCLYGCNIESGANVILIGIDVQAAGHDTLISDCYLEANATNMQLASGVKIPVIIGGFIADGSTANITDNGATDPFIVTRLGNTTYNPYVKWPFTGRGTGTINSGSTSAVITHGLNWTPVASEIVVNFTENPTNTPGAMWIDTITSTQFTVNVENDPGASNLDFGWSARKIT